MNTYTPPDYDALDDDLPETRPVLMETKPWWQSRTIIGAMITVASSGAALAGYVVDVHAVTELALGLSSIIGGALSWWGRVQATRPISTTKVLPGLGAFGD